MLPITDWEVAEQEAEQRRLRRLRAQSEREDTLLVEVVYRDRYVTFDLPSMEARYLSVEALITRYLWPALQGLELTRATDADSSSSFMSSSSTAVS